ncbi:Scr1 family TA system antitoxin-like transcriptional regulator [Streptomyces sp. NPDC101455]|uniref:Scr1 family TA system antitoxin-like transcriptional regulator n=1 Tax=Streptomyces sp. NPDC101455 TaxID=3366142 RepID=UPI00382079E5
MVNIKELRPDSSTQAAFGARIRRLRRLADGRKHPTPRFSRPLEGCPEYVALEGRPVEIRLWEISIIPGLLQTPEHTRALTDSAVRRGAIGPERVQAVTASRSPAPPGGPGGLWKLSQN